MMSGMMLLWAAMQDPSAPAFTKFEFARERIEHKVTVDAVLSNPSGKDLADVAVTSVYYDGAKELRRSRTARIAKIAAGASAAFRLEAEQVPNFSRYEVYVEAGGRTRVYSGDAKQPFPTLKKSEPAKLTIASHSADGSRVTLVVRNSGESEAEEPTAVFPARKTWVRLDRAVPPATEDTFELTLADAGEPSIAWLAAEGLTLPDGAADEKKVTLRQVRIIRLTDGTARITGVVKNGLAGAVDKVTAGFRLGKKEAPYTLPGGLKPGESRPFEHYVPECGPFDAAGFDLSYSEGDAVPAGGPAPPTAKRIGSKKIEIAQAKLPEPAAKQENKGPEEKASVKVELRGIMMVEGISFKQGDRTKYSGDTYILKLAFTDGKGNAFKPTPTLNFVVYNGQEPYKKVQRIVGKEQWNGDAAKVNHLSVADNTIVCDKKTNELWVAFVRTDGNSFDPRIDLTLDLRGAGSWVWKGMDKDKKFESPPRGPDKPEKK